MRFGLHSYLFSTVLRRWFLLVRHVSMGILIGLWHRLFLWVCLSQFLLKGVARPDHRLCSNSQYRRDLCQGLCWGLVAASLPKWPHLESGNEAHLHGKKSAGSTVSTSSTESRRKGGCGGWHSWCATTLHLFILLIIYICNISGWYAFQIFNQWRSITSNRFMLNMVQGHHLQLRSCPPLFHDFWHITVKAAAAHLPAIQCTGGLCPILNLKYFNHFMHITSFKMPTLKNVWQLIQQGDFAFSIDLQDGYLHVPIVKHHHHFLHFVWNNVPYQWKVLPFGLDTSPRVFTSLMKPILFLLPSQRFAYCYLFGWHLGPCVL